MAENLTHITSYQTLLLQGPMIRERTGASLSRNNSSGLTKNAQPVNQGHTKGRRCHYAVHDAMHTVEVPDHQCITILPYHCWSFDFEKSLFNLLLSFFGGATIDTLWQPRKNEE